MSWGRLLLSIAVALVAAASGFVLAWVGIFQLMADSGHDSNPAMCGVYMLGAAACGAVVVAAGLAFFARPFSKRALAVGGALCAGAAGLVIALETARLASWPAVVVAIAGAVAAYRMA